MKVKDTIILVSASLGLMAAVLSSCSKSEQTTSGVGRPMMLSAESERTKTVASGSALPTSYTIYASSYFTSYTAPEADGDYFNCEAFRYDGGLWNSNPVLYWPVGGKIDMLCVALEDDAIDVRKCVTWHEGNCSKGVEVDLRDGDCTDSEILYAAAYDRTAEGGSIPLRFKHAQSWLQFSVGCEVEILRIDRIVLENVFIGGLFRVSNNVYMDAEWVFRGHRRVDVTVPGSEGLIPTIGHPCVCNILVPEQEPGDVAIYYSVKGTPTDSWEDARHSVFRHKAGTSPWFYGEKNLFEINIRFSEICTNVSVGPWIDESKNFKLEDLEDDD